MKMVIKLVRKIVIKKIFAFLIGFFILTACNTTQIFQNEFENAEFFLDARFALTIAEKENYQGSFIFSKTRENFNLKILSPLNTLLAEIKNSENITCLFQEQNSTYCDENIDLLVNYFLHKNNNENYKNNNFIIISEIPNWLKGNLPKNSQIIYDKHNRIQRVDLNINKQHYILIYSYENETNKIPIRLNIKLNNEFYLKLIINNWQEH